MITALSDIVPRPGTMDAVIIAEMGRDPYGVLGRIGGDCVIVDAGANIGAFARFALAQAPGARIVCIEAMAGNVEALRRNLAAFPDCGILEAALMGQAGEVAIHDYGAASSACHSVIGVGASEERVVRVPAVTLSEVMERFRLERIDFLKLDIQGAEFDVIEHAPSELLARIGYIAMESHAAIANADKVLGEIPNHRARLRRMYEKLAETHICVSGYPAHANALLGWMNRERLGVPARLGHRVRLAVGVPAVNARRAAIRLAASAAPPALKRLASRRR